MHFHNMPYQRAAYEAIEADYQALFQDLQRAACEQDCLAVLEAHYRLGEKMTPLDLCYVRHGMNVNDSFYAQEQAYAVSRILYQCQQDEFQQLIYEQPQLTRSERNEVWAKLERDYFPFREYPEGENPGSRWQRIPHTFLWPFYAIDYALAQVCALQYARWMEEDPEAAWKSYLAFCHASGNQNFPEALKTAGLQSPFETGGLKNLMNWLQTRL